MILGVSNIFSVDSDVRYVPDENGQCSFLGLAHESRYMWALDSFDFRNKTVLDLGCGSGYGTHTLSQKAKRIIGIDISSRTIEYARQRYQASNLEFINHDACALGLAEILKKEQFDIIVSFDVIEHLERYPDYLDNIRLLLKDDGLLILGTPNRLQLFEWNREWNKAHFQEFSPWQLKKILSFYFDSINLCSQDIEINLKEKMKKNVLDAQRPYKKNWRTTVGSLLPSCVKKILSNVLSNITKHRDATSGLILENIVFDRHPDTETLNSCFGLIALCQRAKKEGSLQNNLIH